MLNENALAVLPADRVDLFQAVLYGNPVEGELACAQSPTQPADPTASGT